MKLNLKSLDTLAHVSSRSSTIFKWTHTPNKLEAFVEGIVGKQPAKCGAVVVNDSAYIKPLMFKSYRHV